MADKSPSSSTSELESRLLDALRNAPEPLKAVNVARAVGMTVAKEVNPTLYALEKKGLVCKHLYGQTPMWKIAGGSPASPLPPAQAKWNNEPLYTRSDSGNGAVTFYPVHRDDVLNKSLASMSLSKTPNLPSPSESSPTVLDRTPQDGGSMTSTTVTSNEAIATPNGTNVHVASTSGLSGTEASFPESSDTSLQSSPVVSPPTSAFPPQASGVPLADTRSEEQATPSSIARRNRPVKIAANFGPSPSSPWPSSSSPSSSLPSSSLPSSSLPSSSSLALEERVVAYLRSCNEAVEARKVANELGHKTREEVLHILTDLAKRNIVIEVPKEGSSISLWKLAG